jgi:nucleoside-diphosphate-sugar epimerase
MSKSRVGTRPGTVSILGCGWYGLELAKALISKGYDVKGSSTTTEKLEILAKHQIQPFLVNFERDEENYDPAFFQCDTLFVCIPPKRSTGQQLNYHHKIQHISNAAKVHKTSNLIFISSISVYGDLNAEVTELSIPYPETESGVAMLKAENLLKDQNDFTCTIIRFAGLVGPGRDPGRFFAGKTAISNGRAPINLIHLDDCIGISLNIIKYKAFGHIFNACSPDHPSRQEFYTLATANAQLTPPVFIDELLKWKLISGIQAPSLNYDYQISDWIGWLNQNSK